VRFRVVKTRTVEHTWYVEADDQEEAEESGRQGIPQDSTVNLVSSETEVTPWEHWVGDDCLDRHEWVEPRPYLACGASFMAGQLCSLPAGHLEQDGTDHQ
jgi:hypothetical protein